MRGRVAVVGGGLAGITAALDLADAGAEVTLIERRRQLGGLTRSFEHDGRQVDNGQHVFLRCCTEYRSFLARIGSDRDVAMQPRLRVVALRPPAGGPLRKAASGPTRRPGTPVAATLSRNDLPPPLHLAGSLVRYAHLRPAERAAAGLGVLGLRRLDEADPALDRQTFGEWLRNHRQSPAAVEALWDLITVATVNLPAAEASLAVAGMVMRTGLLSAPGAADIGWSLSPLGTLHGERAAAALAAAGVEVRLGRRATALDPAGAGRWRVATEAATGPDVAGGPAAGAPGGGAPGHARVLDAGAVVLAVPHDAAAALLPPGSVPEQHRLGDLGTSAIVNVHLLYDRKVTDEPFFAALGGTAHWVFDRTASSGHRGPGQYLAVTVSAADRLMGQRPRRIAADVSAELAALLPAASGATVVDALVTKERAATFRASPGTAALRPGAATGHPGLAVAGAWTATGWPATMEGAVRSGHAAAAAVLAAPVAVPLPPATRLPEEVA